MQLNANKCVRGLRFIIIIIIISVSTTNKFIDKTKQKKGGFIE